MRMASCLLRPALRMKSVVRPRAFSLFTHGWVASPRLFEVSRRYSDGQRVNVKQVCNPVRRCVCEIDYNLAEGCFASCSGM